MYTPGSLIPTDQLGWESTESRSKPPPVRRAIELPKGWKASIALHLVSSWAENGTTLTGEILDKATLLFTEMNNRFDDQDPT